MDTPRTILIIIAAVIILVLLVCCAVVGVIAVLALMGPAIGNVFSNIVVLTPTP